MDLSQAKRALEGARPLVKAQLDTLEQLKTSSNATVRADAAPRAFTVRRVLNDIDKALEGRA